MNVPTGIHGRVGTDFRGQRVTDVESIGIASCSRWPNVEDAVVDLSAIPEDPRAEPSEQPDKLLR
jgi:hypothetical protein